MKFEFEEKIVSVFCIDIENPLLNPVLESIANLNTLIKDMEPILPDITRLYNDGYLLHQMIRNALLRCIDFYKKDGNTWIEEEKIQKMLSVMISSILSSLLSSNQQFNLTENKIFMNELNSFFSYLQRKPSFSQHFEEHN
ncbi:MAG: hypothetical protein Q8S24_10150 [Eubacteriales bacterium]|nr:hypothetical protein [Eubacteriales bacterium]